MHTAVATSLTPSESVASADTTERPRLALVLAYGAEHVPSICAASHAELDPYGRLDAGHVRESAFSDVFACYATRVIGVFSRSRTACRRARTVVA
jgi:hypothetical protein